MKVYKTRRKSSEDNRPAWNRAKVSIGAAGLPLPMYTDVNIHAPKSMHIYENQLKSLEIHEKL